MTIGRAGRRQARRDSVEARFGPERADSVLDLLELTELAWHDCYGEVSPPDAVVEDILVVGMEDLGSLVRAARLAVEDSRDLNLSAEAIRRGEQ